MTAPSPATAPFPPRLKVLLWGVLEDAENLELKLAQIRLEASLPGELGHAETCEVLERIEYAVGELGRFVILHIGRFGSAS